MKNLTLMACFTSLNVVARLALAGGPPNVKPVAFLAITAGIVTGAFGGLVVGGLSIFISDLYFGGGYWTVIDAASMGAIACLAGLLWTRRENINRIELVVGGFVLTAVYDIAVSVIPAWIFGYNWWIAMLLLYIPFLAGGVIYPFGLIHEFTTAVLMGTVGPALIGRVRTLVNRNM